jgi:LacI family transcriptional regulator
VKPATIEHILSVAENMGFYAVETIRSRLAEGGPEKRFGFLLNSNDRQLYRELAEELASSTAKAVNIRGRSTIVYLQDTNPEKAAKALAELGEQCDAVACICVDHPAVNAAVATLSRNNIPVVTMISDVSAPSRTAFIGSNDWQLGRTAGWFAATLRKQGKAAVLMGSERYICQQTHETGFRNYLRSQQTELKLVESRFTDEADTTAEVQTRSLLEEHPDIAVLFVAGGGIDGVARAVVTLGRSDVAVLGCEMTTSTKTHLTAGVIDVILAHPVREIAREAVRTMIRLTTTSPPHASSQQIVPFAIMVGENC